MPSLLRVAASSNSFFKIFKEFYEKPADSGLALVEGFPKEIDVSEGGPYANYNWELFFHIPLAIAVHLSKNQRFVEAQRWFHYIFDPTDPEKKYWKFLAFRRSGAQIDELLALLSKPDDECTQTELDLKQMIKKGYQGILDYPFQPHRVARTRHLSYQYCVVMKYLDNLIAWGDSLFRQDTIESINEATQRYVLAANLLGPRPQRIPPRGTTRGKTFHELKSLIEKSGDPMGNALVELEGQFPFNLALSQMKGADSAAARPLFGIGHTLYFCIPRNEKLLEYWDTVANRLFKIRHCMNIEGVVRQLALFDPPLDPGMLVKAAAAGIDIGSIVSGLNQPIAPVRSLFFIQKALELAGEVRGLGSALLSAIEKGDSEHMALLRQGHEIKIQKMQQEVRFLQWKQTEEATESLLKSRASALERYDFYLRVLGENRDEETIPDTLTLDRPGLTEENFNEAYAALVGQYETAVPVQDYSQLTLAEETSPANQSGASGQGTLYLNANEDAELNSHLPTARNTRLAASINDAVAASLVFIPDFDVNLHFWGLGAKSRIFGGVKLHHALKGSADVLRMVSAWEQDQASMASRTAGYERRADDWMLQCNLVARELIHIGRQIIGSLIAEQIAHREYLNIQKQIEHSEEIDSFLREKFTNEELYAWMQGEISRLYYEYYRFAFDTARKAEQTMKRELMRPEVDATDYIKFNHWDGGRKGLLSGEALYLDIKRMEMAYHENNKREFELIKHISLRQLNPLALLSLKATGTCEFTVPEWLFDLDGSLYMRRIKTVSLSIPSVAGPYTSLSCTLSLLKSSVRKSPLLSDDGYARAGSEDTRFVDYYGTIQQIVTSSGNNDSGMFETNLRDERFLPFEGAGAISTWKLELPAAFRQFDYNTISDVILHMRYTARQGGSLLGGKATEYLEELVGEANAVGLALLFSLKHDFPSEWHRFLTTENSNFAATVKREYFPYFTQGKEISVDGLNIHSIQDGQLKSVTPQGFDSAALVVLSDALNDQEQRSFELALDPDSTVLDGNPVLERKKEANVFVLIKYSVGS